jgi:hypothetical protein
MDKKNDDAGMPKEKEWALHNFGRARVKSDVVEEDKKNRNGTKHIEVPILTTARSDHSFHHGRSSNKGCKAELLCTTRALRRVDRQRISVKLCGGDATELLVAATGQ